MSKHAALSRPHALLNAVYALLSALLLFTGCRPKPAFKEAAQGAAPTAPPAVAFTVFDPAAGFQPPPIVLQYDPITQSGVDWSRVRAARRRPEALDQRIEIHALARPWSLSWRKDYTKKPQELAQKCSL